MSDLKMQERDCNNGSRSSSSSQSENYEFSIKITKNDLEIKTNSLSNSFERALPKHNLNPSELKNHPTPGLSENERLILKNINDKLNEFHEERSKIHIEFIKQQINDAEQGKITYQICIENVCKQTFETISKMSEVEKNRLPLKTAWILWKHLTPERIRFHYETSLDKAHLAPSPKALHLMQVGKIANGVVNKLLHKGGSTDVKKSVTQKSIYSKIQIEMDNMEEIYQHKYKQIFEYLRRSSTNLARDANALSLALATQLAETFKIGNCYEKSAVLVNFLRKLGPNFADNTDTNVEIISLHSEDGEADHTVVVIGRRKDSDLNDYTTWGNDAIIVDPWLDTVFFPAEIPERLKSYVSGGGTREFHPFKYSLFCLHPDGLSGMREGMKLLHTYDHNLALNHAITTLNLDLAFATISRIATHDHPTAALYVLDLIQGCDDNFKIPCFNHLMQKIIEMNRKDIFLHLMEHIENISEFIINDQDETVFEFASRNQRVEIMALLQNDINAEDFPGSTLPTDVSEQDIKPMPESRSSETDLQQSHSTLKGQFHFKDEIKGTKLMIPKGASEDKIFHRSNKHIFLPTPQLTTNPPSQDKTPSATALTQPLLER